MYIGHLNESTCTIFVLLQIFHCCLGLTALKPTNHSRETFLYQYGYKNLPLKELRYVHQHWAMDSLPFLALAIHWVRCRIVY